MRCCSRCQGAHHPGTHLQEITACAQAQTLRPRYRAGVIASGYPTHWEADVVLRDGRPCHLRPIKPEDGPALREFHSRLSARTVYYRFFSAYPRLTDRDVARFTEVDHVDRVALVATMASDIIGVARYDRLDPHEAEVAFVIQDEHQGRGLGSVMLEHLAAAARERGVIRFIAEVLPENTRMLHVFEQAGYLPDRDYRDGSIRLEFRIEPTARSLSVARDREHRAEARSIHIMMNPRTVAVIGAGRRPGSIGRELLRHLRDGFAGHIAVVHPKAKSVLGVPADSSISAFAPVDLVVLAIPATEVESVIDACATAGVHGLLIVTGGYAETGQEGRQRQRDMVRRAREHGMRVIGPNCFGVINTDPAVRLNASLADMPRAGSVGLFLHSGALAHPILAAVARRDLGISSFVSAGNRADVSGNDLMQFWLDDERTKIVLLYLESLGNPRKFTRIARALSSVKPVIAVRPSRSTQSRPLGHVIKDSHLPEQAIDSLFVQAGIIRTETVDEMLDVAVVLSMDNPPQGVRVAIISSSHALYTLASDALSSAGLVDATSGRVMPDTASPEDIGIALRMCLDAGGIDAVLVVHLPVVVADTHPVEAVLEEVARDACVPVLAVLLHHAQDRGPATHRNGVCYFPSLDHGIRAVGRAAGHALWRGRLAVAALEPEIRRQHDEARALALSILEGHSGAERVDCSRDEAVALLSFYGITVHSARLASKVRKSGAVPVTIAAVDDELFGPVVSFGIAGAVPELMGDRAYRIPPLSMSDCVEMVRQPAASVLLTVDDVDTTAVEDLLRKIGLIMVEVPEIDTLVLGEVMLREGGVVVADVRLALHRPASPGDIRRLND
jgi:acyl-CoA synthetase (NDP forming)/RimJ/RimL family protein N-acetyltransferase